MSNKTGLAPLFKLTLAVLYFGNGLSGGSLRGEDFTGKPIEKTPLPSTPFVRQSGSAAYTVDFTYREAAPPLDENAATELMKRRNARVRQMTVEKVGNQRHEIRRWEPEGLSQTESWWGGTTMFENGFSATGIPNGIHATVGPDAANSFPELVWIGGGNFLGTVRGGGNRIVDVYRISLQGIGGSDPFFTDNEDITVYVDDGTRLPLLFRTAHYSVAYIFDDPPAQLNFPSEFKQAYEIYKERAANPPPPP